MAVLVVQTNEKWNSRKSARRGLGALQPLGLTFGPDRAWRLGVAAAWACFLLQYPGKPGEEALLPERVEKEFQFALGAGNREPSKDETADDQSDASDGDLYRDFLAKRFMEEALQQARDPPQDQRDDEEPGFPGLIGSLQQVHRPLSSSVKFQRKQPSSALEILGYPSKTGPMADWFG